MSEMYIKIFFSLQKLRAISKQGKSVFVEFVSNRNRQICRAKQQQTAMRGEVKNLPHGDKNIKFPFSASMLRVYVAISLPCNTIGIDNSNMEKISKQIKQRFCNFEAMGEWNKDGENRNIAI